MRDPRYVASTGRTYAQTLHGTFPDRSQRRPARKADAAGVTGDLFPNLGEEPKEQESVDVLAEIEQQVIEQLCQEKRLIDKIKSAEGVAWGAIKAFCKERLPEHLDGRDDLAYHLVRKAMTQIYGPQRQAWEAFRNAKGTTCVHAQV